MTYTLTYDLDQIAPGDEREIKDAAVRLAPSGATLHTCLIDGSVGQISYDMSGSYDELDDGELHEFLDARCQVDKTDDADENSDGIEDLD